MSWSGERIAELKQLWSEGHSAAEIGRRLEVSKNAVIGKAHRLGLPSRPSPIKRERLTAKRAAKPAMSIPPKQKTKGPSCCWPNGDPGDVDFYFCGKPAVVGKPYCAEHYDRAYILTRPSKGGD
jgi:GcrA cell cycle regulator